MDINRRNFLKMSAGLCASLVIAPVQITISKSDRIFCNSTMDQLPVGAITYIKNAFEHEAYLKASKNEHIKCAGGSLPRDHFSELYAVLGNTYGESGGEFKLPDLRGTFPPFKK